MHFFLLPHLNWQISQNFFAISRQTFKIIAIQDPNFNGKTFQRPKFRREKAKNYHLISKKISLASPFAFVGFPIFVDAFRKVGRGNSELEN